MHFKTSMMGALSIFVLLSISFLSLTKQFVSPEAPSIFISEGLCFLWFAIEVLKSRTSRMKRSCTISPSELLIMLFLLYSFAFNIDKEHFSTEWLLVGISSLAFFMISRRGAFNVRYASMVIVLLGTLQAIYGLCQYFHLFRTLNQNFRICGTFDNPAGFAASLMSAFPFALFFLSGKGWRGRTTGLVSILVIVSAIVLSKSRAGLLSILIMGTIWLCYRIKATKIRRMRRSFKITIMVILFILITVGLYFLKKNSADGRLLIWRCTANMILDRPLFGFGTGGFLREYMYYQAKYFSIHPDSPFVMLADNVKHPFNEILLLLVEYGLAGFLVVAFFMGMLIKTFRKSTSTEKNVFGLCLVGMFVFGNFSYLLSYPFARLVLLFSAGRIMKDEVDMIHLPKNPTLIIKPVCLIVCTAFLVVTGIKLYDEYRWSSISRQSLAGKTIQVLPEYARLHRAMGDNPYFLYNYGAELNFIARAKESNELMQECLHYYNDIDVQLIIADNYQHQKSYRSAERSLLLAHQMIPYRIAPLYRLVLLYNETGRNTEAIQLARNILRMPVKVQSPEVSGMKIDLKNMILMKKNI